MRRLSVFNPWNVSPRWMGWDDEGFGDIADMSMDVYEEGENVFVKLLTPGFSKDQLDISIESGKITVVGKAKQETESEDKNKKYYRKEISLRSFTRSCALPVEVVPDGAQADYTDGVLVITIPKSEAAKPKKIQVRVDT